METWKKINNYPYYEVSNLGNVRSLDKLVNGRFGLVNKKGKVIKGFLRNEYMSVGLSNNNMLKMITIHRLVAEHFIPNLENKETVNHINGIKTDNRVENLEWATPSEQIKHAIFLGLYIPPIPYLGKTGILHNRSKKLIQYAINNIKIKEYGSAREAAKFTGLQQTGISKCCRGELKQCGGYKWQFA